MNSGSLKKILACAVFLAVLPATAGAISLSSISTVYYPGSTLTVVKGLNDNGEVVGEYWDNSAQKFHGFYYDGSNYINTDRPGGWNETWGINNNGTIVGGGTNSANHYSGYYSMMETTVGSPYKDWNVFNTVDFSGSNFSELFGINDYNMMVGGYGDGTYHPFIYDLSQDTYTWLDAAVSLPNVRNTTPISINNSNQVVGSYVDTINSARHGFFYDGSSYTSIDMPGAFLTEAMGINDQGKIVGYFQWCNSCLSHGFIYNVLSQEFTILDIGSKGTRIYGINNSGQIAGGYIDQNSIQNGFIASFVPLPPALLLFGSGLAGLLGVTRFRKGRTGNA